MYIPVQEKKKDEFANFFGELFGKEQSFGDKVASDIEALNKVDNKKVMSKTTKAVIGVTVGAVVLFAGYKLMKKFKK